MIDWFVLLTPLLMLGVIALVRFVGCNQVFGIVPTATYAPPPTNLNAIPGDRRINLTWDYEPGDATRFAIYYHEFTMGEEDKVADYGEYAGAEILIQMTQGQVQRASSSLTENLENGRNYAFRVVAYTHDSSSSLYEVVPTFATPGVHPFLKVTTPGALRNNLTGWVGMAVLINANADVIVTQLGRLVLANNVRPHELRIIDAGQNDAVLATVTVSMPAGPIGEFAYQPLVPPVTLLKNRLYYFVTHEDDGGDTFYDINGLVVDATDSVAIGTIFRAVYSDVSTNNMYVTYGSNNQTYGPVNFTY